MCGAWHAFRLCMVGSPRWLSAFALSLWLALASVALGCGGGLNGDNRPDASSEGSAQGSGGSSSGGVAPNVCSTASPCAAGTSGCPGSGLPIPNEGDACSIPGLGCYGYGSLSCPLTLTCGPNLTWRVTCPAHPFGLDSGSCGCANGVVVTPPDASADGGSDGATSCPSGVACGCSCPTSYDGGVCVCANFSMPECPLSAQSSPAWPACDFAGPCMNCLGGAAGIICNCTDAGLPSTDAGGAQWQCIPTEQACTGGTFHG